MGFLLFLFASHFSLLTHLSPQAIDGYQEKIVHEDLVRIAEALSILFEQESTSVLQDFLGDQYFLVDDYNASIDHVGRELLGPLSFYLPLLDELAPQLGLIHLRDLVFPSTQVVATLRQHDPDLRSVTIGRIYFQNVSGGKIKSLELFQASAPIETRLLGAFIDHLAIELSTAKEVEEIHDRICRLSSETLLPYQEKVSYNPGDGSTQTKAIFRDSESTVFNKIIEFVHYE